MQYFSSGFNKILHYTFFQFFEKVNKRRKVKYITTVIHYDTILLLSRYLLY